jgi:catechol 2,3-dioxygenase-like lactoylglutathione lyase family enzyme
MRLNHVDLQVSDVDRAREFFETLFDFRCVFQRRAELAILEDEAGFSLGVSNLFGSPAPVYPPDFHVGFVLETEAQVRAQYERLTRAGVEMKAEHAIGGPNLYFMCVGPDSIPVEVRAPRDAAQSRPPSSGEDAG